MDWPARAGWTGMTTSTRTIALLWRGTGDTPVAETRNYGRLLPVFNALSDIGVIATPVLYDEATAGDVRGQLLAVDAVLVWVDPIAGGQRREALDSLLREVSVSGRWVSAHPDVIDRIGTKEVLYETRDLGWGADTDIYLTAAELRERLPDRLKSGAPRVLKQSRGNGGLGVWKVAPIDPAGDTVCVQHAAPRDHTTEDIALGEFLDRCEDYFAAGCTIVDQPFATRLDEGMIRAYLVEDKVVGYARQRPAPAAAGTAGTILGMPSAKTMSDADDPTLEGLRRRLEDEWIPGLRARTGLSRRELPILWDADFLYGDPTVDGDDTYMLCEINASSVLPFPPGVAHALAEAVAARLRTS